MENSKTGTIFLHLILDTFKTKSCPTACGRPDCSFYHSTSELRRPQSIYSYSKTKCRRKYCKADCKKAHNVVEQKYHILDFKKTYCQEQAEEGKCRAKDVCFAAHADYELKIVPLHVLPFDLDFIFFRFKSEFCPMMWKKHDYFFCVYAHNWQDFKRPFSASLKPVQCPQWNRHAQIFEYKSGCPEGFSCNNCHGWKEINYHPTFYKTVPCQKCPLSSKLPDRFGAEVRNQFCPFIHPDERPPESLDTREFSVAPKAINYQKGAIDSYLVEVGAKAPQPASFKNPVKAASQRMFSNCLASFDQSTEPSIAKTGSFAADSKTRMFKLPGKELRHSEFPDFFNDF